MTTKSLKTCFGLLTALVVISSTVVLVTESTMAQPAGPTRMNPAGMDKMIEIRVDRMAKTVDATPEQKEKLLTIAKAAQTDVKPMHEQIRTRMDLAMTQLKEVLSPEQRAKWDEKMKSRQAHEKGQARMADHMKKND